LIVVAVLLTATACSSEPDEGSAPEPSASSTSPQDSGSPSPSATAPAFTEPEKGECRNLSAEDVPPRSNDTEPVDCSRRHTALTFLVGTYPARFERLTRQARVFASHRCGKAWRDAIGIEPTDLPLTVLSFGFFSPTEKEWNAGARFFRCDLLAYDDTDLIALPGKGRLPLLAGTVPDALARCITDGNQQLPCSRPHDYRAVGTRELLGSSSSYPTRADFLARAGRFCPPLTGTSRWWATWPSEESWTAGARLMTCYRPEGTVA